MRDTNGKEVVLQPKVFAGGLPTKLDVDKLIEHFGIPQEDVLMRWTEIEQVLRLNKHSHRFATVVDAWRKQLLELHNVYLEAVSGHGLKASGNADRVKAAHTSQRRGFRKIVKAGKLAAATEAEGLTPELRRLRDHVASVGASHALALRTEAKTLNFKSAVGK